MKKQIIRTMALAMLAFACLLPTRVSAEEAGRMLLSSEGVVTLQSPQAAAEEISSLQFTVKVEASGTDVVADFEFSQTVMARAKVFEFRYDQGEKTLKIYIAGTTALLDKTGILSLGKISVTNGAGGKVSAKVSIEEDSLMFVYGTDVLPAGYISLPAPVILYTVTTNWPPIVVGPSQSEDTPTPTPEPKEEEEEEETDPVQGVLELTILEGRTCQLKVALQDADEKGQPAFSSSNTKVATVSEEGLVTAKEKGSAAITVKLPNGKEMVCKVIVK